MTDAYPTLFDSLTKRRSATYAARVRLAIAALEAGKAAGSIPNPAFVEAKDMISRMVDEAWSDLYSTVNAGSYHTQPTHIREWLGKHPFPYIGVSRFGAALEKWLKDRPVDANLDGFVQQGVVMMREVKALGALLDEMKGKAVKRQPKAEGEAEARFKAPPVSTEATRQVKTMLETLVNGQFEALVAAFETRYRNEIARFVKVRDEKLAEIAASDKPKRIYPLSFYARQNSGVNMNFLSKVLDTVADYREITPVVRDDAEQITAATARADAEEVREFFVAKNLRKIVSIIEAKEKVGVAMTSCKPIAHTISLGGLEGAFVVDFADGSGFRFNNAVVFKVSIHGTPFNQFPLTFHDVKLPGGVKMPRPSEERMNTVFLGKEAD